MLISLSIIVILNFISIFVMSEEENNAFYIRRTSVVSWQIDLLSLIHDNGMMATWLTHQGHSLVSFQYGAIRIMCIVLRLRQSQQQQDGSKRTVRVRNWSCTFIADEDFPGQSSRFTENWTSIQIRKNMWHRLIVLFWRKFHISVGVKPN